MKQWAITVGINQYQHLQPLGYAQRDAQAVWNFLVQEAGFAAENCLLMTDTSPPKHGKSTYPNRENIQGWLEIVSQQDFQPGDVLWFFFSGYGICQRGQDYLLPIEAHPDTVTTTGIPVEALFDRLQSFTAGTVLVLLDMSRSQAMSLEAVGVQTQQIASQRQIPTILSCQPGQFSREATALQHGLFTSALLESLRAARSTTLETLDRYLSLRLPELSEHHWRPIQQPLTLCPPEKRHQIILPRVVTSPQTWTLWNQGASSLSRPLPQFTNGAHPAFAETAPAPTSPVPPRLAAKARLSAIGRNGHGAVNGSSPVNGASPITERPLGDRAVTPTDQEAFHRTSGSTQPLQPLPQRVEPNGQNASSPAVPSNGVVNGNALGSHSSSAPSHSTPESGESAFWRSALLWGGTAIALLLAGVFWKYGNTLLPAPRTQPTAQNLAPNPSIAAGQWLIVQTRTPKPPTPTQPAGDRTSRNGGSTALPPNEPALNQGNLQNSDSSHSEAKDGANWNNPKPTEPAQQPKSGLVSLAVLELARSKTLVKSDQASAYWYAIQEAKKVSPQQPEFKQAQVAIADWSREILAIAQRRFALRSYDTTILAARLVPQNQPFHPEARRLIAQSCPLLRRSPGKNPVQQRQAIAYCRSRSSR